MHTNHRIDQDRCWQQFGTQPILISAPQWSHRPCNAPARPYRVGKKPSVKADLAIYGQVVDASGQCMSISLILGFNLDFSSCDNLVGFCKSSHVYASQQEKRSPSHASPTPNETSSAKKVANTTGM